MKVVRAQYSSAMHVTIGRKHGEFLAINTYSSQPYECPVIETLGGPSPCPPHKTPGSKKEEIKVFCRLFKYKYKSLAMRLQRKIK